jgi:cytidyltransferase-like protein
MSKKEVLIYVGSFKPPHRGHYKLIKEYIKKYDKIIIIISNKPRPLNRLLKEIDNLDKDKINNILGIDAKSKKEGIEIYKKKINEDVIPNINSKESEKIWSIYLKYLDKKYRDKISIIISRINSPIKLGMSIYNKLDKLKYNVTFLKSEKNKNNKRFGEKVEIIGKYFEKINSTDIRELILLKKRKEFYKYLPVDLTEEDKLKVWKIVK